MTAGNLRLLLVLGLLAGVIRAQDATSTSSPQASPAPSTSAKYCNDFSNMNFDVAQISGTWYEMARHPAPANSLLCAQITLSPMSDNALNVSFTYSNTPSYPWVNQTMDAQVTVEANNTQGYDLSFTMYGQSYPLTTYKILATDYTNYTFVCGYTNISDFNTFFSIVLTRERIIDSSTLNEYENIAQASFGIFSNTSMATISQSTECSANDGVVTAKIVSFLMALMYSSLALFC